MIDIFPQILYGIREAINAYSKSEEGNALLGSRTVKVSDEYLFATQKFPCVTVEEKLNGNAEDELDFVEKRSELMYEINIYDISVKQKETCRKLAKVIDKYMSKDLGFLRINGEPFPNLADSKVYRYLMRFEGYIDTETGIVSRKL